MAELPIPILQMMIERDWHFFRFALLFRTYALGGAHRETIARYSRVEKGKEILKYYFLDRLHRDTNSPDGPGPALVHDTEYVRTEKWFRFGKEYSTEDQPSEILVMKSTGQITYHHRIGQHLHRKTGPAIYYNNQVGGIWSLNGVIHRDEYGEFAGPAVDWDVSKKWKKQGLYHREAGPAMIEFDKNGKLVLEVWYVDDRIHRDDNLPAIISGGSQVCPYFCPDADKIARYLINQITKPFRAWFRHGAMYKIEIE